VCFGSDMFSVLITYLAAEMANSNQLISLRQFDLESGGDNIYIYFLLKAFNKCL